MVTLAQLWLPIIVSAALVFIASAVLWMLVGHHNKDWKGLPNEEAARATLRGAAPGQYMIPHGTHESMKDPEFVRRFEEGPRGIVTIAPAGHYSMGKNLVQSFILYLLISIIVAYVAGRTLPPGTEYLQVFRVVGTVAFLAYSGAHAHNSIWFSKPWSATIKDIIDGLVYALLTAGVFGWRWPAN
jgi:hypothetical protein